MSQDLKELAQRKQELLLESEINRQILSIEFNQLQLKAAEWRGRLAKAGTIYKFAAPVAGLAAGFFAARKRFGGGGMFSGHNSHNGHDGKMRFVKMLLPLAAPALRQAFALWRRRAAAQNEE